MRHVLLPLAVYLLLAGGNAPHAAANGNECQRLEKQRAQLVRQLRRAHSLKQANRLHERLRDVRTRLAHECR